VSGKRGPVELRKIPRLAATVVANMLTVATHALFMDRGDLKKSWVTFMNSLFMSFRLFKVDSFEWDRSPGDCPRSFPLEAVQDLVIFGQLFRHELQCRMSVEADLISAVDFVSVASARFANDPAMAGQLADQGQYPYRKFSTSIRSLPISSSCVYRTVCPSGETSIDV
jgi:hypothetical protein